MASEGACVIDADSGVVLYGRNEREAFYPASITKVMTALVAIRHGNLSDLVTVTDDAVITESGASLCNIHPGDRLTLEQLLYGLMLPSGNDAGAAIAVHISGSIPAFAELMNEEAAALGATGTHFTNPHGLTDEDHYTTAYDLYLILNEALKEPEFRTIAGTSSYYAEYVDSAEETVSQTWKMGNQHAHRLGLAHCDEGDLIRLSARPSAGFFHMFSHLCKIFSHHSTKLLPLLIDNGSLRHGGGVQHDVVIDGQPVAGPLGHDVVLLIGV